jgi:hypothetical protein
VLVVTKNYESDTALFVCLLLHAHSVDAPPKSAGPTRIQHRVLRAAALEMTSWCRCVRPTLRFKDRFLPCATNILVITRQGRRVAQAVLELCGSSERRDLVTFISSMSLNAERVASRTSTPWKSRQHKTADPAKLQTGARQATAGRVFSSPL